MNYKDQISQANLNLEEARSLTQTEKDIFDEQIARQRVDLSAGGDTETGEDIQHPGENIEPEKEKEPKERRILGGASKDIRNSTTTENKHSKREEIRWLSTSG